MPITVVDKDDDVQTFADANNWHVDNFGHLHLRGSNNKQVATFAHQTWVSVGISEAAK